jgi:hypothetical protein
MKVGLQLEDADQPRDTGKLLAFERLSGFPDWLNDGQEAVGVTTTIAASAIRPDFGRPGHSWPVIGQLRRQLLKISC